MQGRNVTQLTTTNCVIIMIHLSILHLSAWALINTCTEKHTFLSTRELWMDIQTPDNNEGHFDHAVVVINGQLILQTSFRFYGWVYKHLMIIKDVLTRTW